MKDQKRQGTAQILLSLFAQICFLILFLKVFFILFLFPIHFHTLPIGK